MTGILNEEQLDWRGEGGSGGLQRDTESLKKNEPSTKRDNGLVSFPPPLLPSCGSLTSLNPTLSVNQTGKQPRQVYRH